MIDTADERRSTLGERMRSRLGLRARPAAPPAQPIEVHEHIEVEEPASERMGREEVANELVAQRRDARYHDFLASRRAGRFRLAALFVLGLAVLAVLWVVNGAVRAETGMLALGGDLTLAAVLVGIVVGFAAAVATWRGHLAGLIVAWVAGLAGIVVALSEAANLMGFTQVTQAVVVLMGLFGLGAMVASTLGIASWRGVRAQRRILAGSTGPLAGRRRWQGGRVS